MALEFLSNIVSRYKADVSDHVAGLKKLKGEERERAKATIEANEKIKASLEDQIKSIAKVATAIAGAYAAGRVAIESYRYALEESRLEIGAAGVDIDGLRKSSRGLRADTDLLRDAVLFKSAALKMSQRDMEDVEGAMRKWAREGRDAAKVQEAVRGAVTKLSTEGLQELGINIKKAGLSMDDAGDRAELFKRIMQALRAESDAVSDAELTKQEQMVASGVAFENAVDMIKRAIGDMVVALAPLIQKVADLVAQIAKVPGYVKTGAEHSATYAKKGANIVAGLLGYDDLYLPEDFYATTGEEVMLGINARAKRTQRIRQLLLEGKAVAAARLAAGNHEDVAAGELAQLLAALGGGLVPDGRTADPKGDKYKGKAERDKNAATALAEAKRKAEEAKKLAASVSKSLTDALVEQLEDEAPDVEDAFIKFSSNLGDMISAIGEKAQSGISKMVAARDRQKTFLESAFGPIDEFSRYAAAFNILTTAVTASMDAWITGSESLGTAFKRAVGAGLKALASELAIQALKHGAYAIGSLAFGDVRGAALHGTASAQFAAGSIAAMAAARAMGHGGADYGGGTGGRGSPSSAAPQHYSGGSGSANDNKETIVYVVGDAFDTETDPRRRQANAERLLRGVSRKRGGGQY